MGNCLEHACGIAGNDRVGRHVFRYDTPGSDDRSFADGNAAKNSGPGSDRGAALYSRVFARPIRTRGGDAGLVGGPRVAVVRKRDPMADENLVLDRDTFANEGMARDLAAMPNLGTALNFNKCPNLYMVSNFASVEIHKSKDAHTFPQLYIGGY